ncbi:hypothetical protein [Paenibacillus popilliae]|nr:hypothetical protein [Paenibacillus popilliae]
MSQDSYSEFLEALSMNREIEFTYNGTLYALVYHQEGWCLVNRNATLSKYYNDNLKLLELEIDGHTIKELLKNNKITIEVIF